MDDAVLLAAAVGDGLVLFDRARVRAHGLNASAALVWRTIEDLAREEGGEDPLSVPVVVDPAAVAARVAAVVGAPDAGTADAIRRQTVEVVDLLQREGVLAGAATHDAVTVPGPPRGFPNVPYTDEVAPPLDDVDWLPPTGPYRGLDVTFDVTCDDPDLDAYLARALAPLRIAGQPDPEGEAPGPPRADHRYQVLLGPAPTGDRHLLVLDGRVVARAGTDPRLAALLLWHVNQLVSETSSQWLIHASAIVPAGAAPAPAIVFPAHRNSGKSTLAAALVADGHRYVTDETVGVDLRSGEVIPYPKAIALDPGSWPLLAELAPAVAEAERRFEHDKWYCDVERTHPGATVRGPVPVGAIVFPTFDPSHPTELAPVPAVQAAVQLAQNSFNLGVVGQEGLAVLAHLAATRPCFRLSMRDLAGARAALQPLLTGHLG